jgi:hypothetical protein
VTDRQHTLMSQKLKTPRAAAVAGILFAVLFSTSVVLIRLSIPANPEDGGVWLRERAGSILVNTGHVIPDRQDARAFVEFTCPLTSADIELRP